MQIPAFELERYFAKHEFSTPYLLCSSDCETLTIGELLEMEAASAETFHSLRLGYTEYEGNPLLRKEIASLYSDVEPAQVMVHSGAEEAIFLFMNAVLQKGDHLIVHHPCYQSLFEVANQIGCEVTKWTTREDDWELDLDFLRRHLRHNTKATVINCPHNPTGYLVSKEKLLEIDRLSQEWGFVIFSDEIYRFLEYDIEDRLPALCDINDTAVSLGVMSKTFGLAGLRIGWVATKNRDIYEKMSVLKDYTTICCSAPSEFLATVALRNKNRIIERNRDTVLKNLEVLNHFFADHQDLFNWRPPKAGPIAFPSLARDDDVERFCKELVNEAGVLLLPGTVYDRSYTRNFRIGFGRKNIPECVDRLRDFIIKCA